QAAKLDTEEQTVMALLRAGHLIRTTGTSCQEKIETYHNRIRETLISCLSKERLKSHHHELALALEAFGRVDFKRLAKHFESAGDFDKAIEYATIAVGQATEALAFEHAAQLYKFTLDLLEKSDVTRKSALISNGRGQYNQEWLANFHLCYGSVL